MAANMQISQAAAIAAGNAILDLLDADSPTPGYIEIRTGSPPASVDDAATGTLLATLTLSDPAFDNGVDDTPGALFTADTITDDSSADATNTAGWFRAYDGAGVGVLQGTVGTGTSDMILNTTAIVTGSTVSITSWTVLISEG